MSQGQANPKEKSEKKSKRDNIPGQRDQDEYKAPADIIWGDVIRHEKVLEKRWSETWTDTIVPKELRPRNYNHLQGKEKKLGEDAKCFYCPRSSPPIPMNSSGWRSCDPSYSMEYFDVKYTSNKVRFIPQQYGFYRHVKYLKADPEETVSKETTTLPPRRGIRHVVKCLVC